MAHLLEERSEETSVGWESGQLPWIGGRAAWVKRQLAAALQKGKAPEWAFWNWIGVSASRSGWLFRLGRALLFDFLNLVEQVVGLLGECVAFAGGFDHVGLAAIEQVEIGHGVVVVRLQVNGLFQFFDAVIDQGAEFRNVILTHIGRERIGVLHLFVDMRLVVIGAEFRVAAIGEGPVNHTDGIIGLRIVRPQFNMLQVIGFGLVKFLGVKGLAGHLIKDGCQSINGAHVVGIFFESALVFLNGFVAVANVLVGRSAGNILAGVSGGEIETRVQKIRIEFLGLLEKFDSLIVLSVLESGDTFVEVIARLQLGAAGQAAS